MALKKLKNICIALFLIVFVLGALFAIKKYNAQRYKVFLTKLIENGNIRIIDDYFTNHSGELNPDYYQLSPLYLAVIMKKYDVAIFLLKKGANPNQKYIEFARTDHPKYDRIECVSYVLPTLVRQTTDGADDLQEKLALMNKLICMGADIYQVNWKQGTPDDPSLWYFAATTGNLSVLKTLLKYNPNVNYTAEEDCYSCIKGILLRTDKYLYRSSVSNTSITKTWG